jgi:hypothetical protein
MAQLKRSDIEKQVASLPLSDQLAILKAYEEVIEFRRPLFKKWGFWLAMFPVVAALVGFIITWRQGWFDLKLTEIRVQRLILDRDVKDLTVEKKILSDSVNAVRSLKQDLVEKYSRDAAEFTVKAESLKASYRSQIDLLSLRFKSQQEEFSSRFDSLQNEAVRAPIQIHLAELLKQPTRPNHPSENVLVGILRGNDKRARLEAQRELSEVADTSTNASHRGICCYIMLMGTRMQFWEQKLLDQIGKIGHGDEDLQWIFATGQLDDSTCNKAFRLFIQNCLSVDPQHRCESIRTCHSAIEIRGALFDPFEMEGDPGILLDGIILARNCALESARSGQFDGWSLGMLKGLSAGAYCVTVATILANGDENLLRQSRSDISIQQMMNDLHNRRFLSTRYHVDLPQPEDDQAHWKSWLAQNDSLRSLWTEPNLERLRTDDRLLKQALYGMQ